MKAIIVDDEPQSHVVLRNFIAHDHPDLNIVASGHNVDEGLKLIREYHPELVFLDIEMPDGLGFDLLKNFDNPEFNVIFITAHNKYAISAIRFGALDFLLKPLSRELLWEALERVREKHREQLSIEQWKIAFETFQKIKEKKLPSRMSVSTHAGIFYIPVEDIVRFEAQVNQTEIFYTSSKKRLIASVNLGEYEEQFEPYPQFMRVHRSTIVNLLMVERFDKSEGSLELRDGSKVFVSRMYKDELMRRMTDL